MTLGVTEPFVTTFTVAGYAALLLALPFLLYQAYAFVLPAFSPREQKVALPLMLMVPALFLAGVAFGYFVALPRAIHFLLTFNDGNFDILIRATDYYKFAIVLIALIGLLFQIPVGVLAVTRLGIISARQLAKSRGYVILGIAVVAAVATPTPDPVTMLIAMAPLLVLFELSVLLARDPRAPPARRPSRTNAGTSTTICPYPRFDALRPARPWTAPHRTSHLPRARHAHGRRPRPVRDRRRHERRPLRRHRRQRQQQHEHRQGLPGAPRRLRAPAEGQPAGRRRAHRR